MRTHSHHPFRPKTVYEVIAEKWNSRDFNPHAPASQCHIDYQTSIDCTFNAVSTHARATPEKIEDIFVALRTNLIWIIQNWEKSGQGDGGSDQCSQCSDDDADDEAASGPGIGALQGRSARALDNRAAFLYGKPSYILYFWEVADQHQLLQSVHLMHRMLQSFTRLADVVVTLMTTPLLHKKYTRVTLKKH
jgi:hypothetical protein